MAERVTFLGQRDDVPAMLASLDVFVQSSLSEGLSNALLEAMALGCPIVATEIGPNAEAVRHLESALLVPPADPQALADAILRLRRDPRSPPTWPRRRAPGPRRTSAWRARSNATSNSTTRSWSAGAACPPRRPSNHEGSSHYACSTGRARGGATMKRPRVMRVVLVGPAPDHLGGTAALIKEMLRDLPSAGVEVRAVATDEIASWLPQFFDRVRYVRTGLRFGAYLARLAQAVMWGDVVHAFAGAYLNFLLEPLPAIIMARARCRRVVLNYHTGEAEDHLRRWGRLVRWAAGKAQVFVVPSRYLQEIFGRAGINAVVVPNSIEVPATVPARQGSQVIVNTRALEPIYDIACTLRAFALVQRQYPEARLVLVGRGGEADRCRRLAEELGLRGVEFVGGVARERGAAVSRHRPRCSSTRRGWTTNHFRFWKRSHRACRWCPRQRGESWTWFAMARPGCWRPSGDHTALAAAACRVLSDPGLAERLARGDAPRRQAHTWAALRDLWLDVYGASRAAEPRRRAPQRA